MSRVLLTLKIELEDSLCSTMEEVVKDFWWAFEKMEGGPRILDAYEESREEIENG